MRLSYDAMTDIAHLTLRPISPDELLGPTLLLENDREFPGAVAVDFSLSDGRVVGLEFQNASACLPADLLAGAVRDDGMNAERRLGERVLRRLGTGLRVTGGRPAAGRDRSH